LDQLLILTLVIDKISRMKNKTLIIDREWQKGLLNWLRNCQVMIMMLRSQ